MFFKFMEPKDSICDVKSLRHTNMKRDITRRYTSYATLSRSIPRNIPRVASIFSVYTRAFRSVYTRAFA